MESQNQEIVASGSPAEVPNDPGYGERGKIQENAGGCHRPPRERRGLRFKLPDNPEMFHYIDHQRSTTRERTDRGGGRVGEGE